jgi:hypothetical protein
MQACIQCPHIHTYIHTYIQDYFMDSVWWRERAKCFAQESDSDDDDPEYREMKLVRFT